MKIGFDISQTGNCKAGCGYFAASLIQTLTELDRENEYLLYPYFGSDFTDPKANKSTCHILLPTVQRIVVGDKLVESKLFWENFPDDGEKRLGSPDIVHANNYFCPKELKKAKLVYTLYDLSFLEFPEFTTEQNRWICFNGVFNASVTADYIVAISDFSRDKFLEFFPHYPLDRINTVHLGSRFLTVSTAGREKKSIRGLHSGKFWLSVGTLEPRKNLRTLLKAFSKSIRETECQYPLVLTGGKGWLEDDLEVYIEKLGIKNNVKLTGYVPDEDLTWLYKNCLAFIYPSLYEGFGLPVLEAMSMGAAVITSNTTSIPEVAGDAACLIDPCDIEQIVGAFISLSDNDEYRSRLKINAIEQARKFSWEEAAAAMIEIYNHVMSMPKFGNPSL